jgi:hypothetical protein
MDDDVGRICSLRKSDSLPAPITVYEMDWPSFLNYEIREKINIFAGRSVNEMDVLGCIDYNYSFRHRTACKDKFYWRLVH